MDSELVVEREPPEQTAPEAPGEAAAQSEQDKTLPNAGSSARSPRGSAAMVSPFSLPDKPLSGILQKHPGRREREPCTHPQEPAAIETQSARGSPLPYAGSPAKSPRGSAAMVFLAAVL